MRTDTLPLDPDIFVAEWLDAWNAHDVDRVLAHFHDDATFASPFAVSILDGSDGVCRGKPAIREYWQAALALVPDLHFELHRFCVGVNTVVIEYRNQRGVIVDEVLIFDGALVRHGFGTYPPDAIPTHTKDLT